jgi:hypothetical protein
MGFILSIIAYVIFFILVFPNFIAVLLKNKKRSSFLSRVNGFWKVNAIELDKFGNYHFATLFNMTLRKKNGTLHGDKNETISSVLGKNQRDKQLTITGWVVVVILYIIDVQYWGKGGHCLNSI